MLRVATWNVRSLRDDARGVAAALRGLDADLVCVQEAPRLVGWRTSRARRAGCGLRTRSASSSVERSTSTPSERQECRPQAGQLCSCSAEAPCSTPMLVIARPQQVGCACSLMYPE